MSFDQNHTSRVGFDEIGIIKTPPPAMTSDCELT